MSNLESRLNNLKALNFPWWDAWFMGLNHQTLEGMITYLDIFMKSTKAAFNVGETEITFDPPVEYREHFNRWARIAGHT